jgi:hypothetical protein
VNCSGLLWPLGATAWLVQRCKCGLYSLVAESTSRPNPAGLHLPTNSHRNGRHNPQRETRWLRHRQDVGVSRAETDVVEADIARAGEQRHRCQAVVDGRWSVACRSAHSVSLARLPCERRRSDGAARQSQHEKQERGWLRHCRDDSQIVGEARIAEVDRDGF